RPHRDWRPGDVRLRRQGAGLREPGLRGRQARHAGRGAGLPRTGPGRVFQAGGNRTGRVRVPRRRGVVGGDVMTRGESQKTQEGGWRQAYSQRRFGVLLVILVVLLAGPPVLLGFGLSALWFDGLMALLMVAVIVSLCFERHQWLFALLLGIPTVLLSLGG